MGNCWLHAIRRPDPTSLSEFTKRERSSCRGAHKHVVRGLHNPSITPSDQRCADTHMVAQARRPVTPIWQLVLDKSLQTIQAHEYKPRDFPHVQSPDPTNYTPRIECVSRYLKGQRGRCSSPVSKALNHHDSYGFLTKHAGQHTTDGPVKPILEWVKTTPSWPQTDGTGCNILPKEPGIDWPRVHQNIMRTTSPHQRQQDREQDSRLPTTPARTQIGSDRL
jgi:hypothetical protein